ncbi:centrosomal protein of 95 kDa isoform X2 [Podarcis raffonei]|uniref:centrosomal protein of 95 kDa isoform X2 n=1 Tax=Podarcis raffonei TaxID=65483 RepID=UPI0023293CAB|nr:centrosomal protein of 95 kDa isoform X2 [Podarcis raffonei]
MAIPIVSAYNKYKIDSLPSEWVNVANDLLTKCNIDLHVSNLSDCGAKVFIHLYESILGERVPDVIATPLCPEDDAHNVQAVIDSLALDYLQISLSHITGENIVRGNKESIRNLLEIFDGLLEYLTEEISETASQNGDLNQRAEDEVQTTGLEEEEGGVHDVPVPSLTLPSASGSSRSSEIDIPSYEVDGSESTSELIKLGDTAYLFSLRNEELPTERDISKKITKPEDLVAFGGPSSGRRALVRETQGTAKSALSSKEQLCSNAKKLGEPIRPAIPLQPPFQPSASRPSYLTERGAGSSGRRSPPPAKPCRLASSDPAEPLGEESGTLSSDILSLSTITSAVDNEPASETGVNEEADEPVLEDTIDDAGKERNENVPYTPASCFEKDRLPQFATKQSTRPKQRNLLPGKSQKERSITDSLAEEASSHQTAKEKLSEQELKEMSDKLSRRMNELEGMLKHALGEQSKEEEEESSADEDNLSQHSDSIMDYRRRKPELGVLRFGRAPSRRRSLSASPPPSSHHLTPESGGALWKDVRGPMGRMRDRVQKEKDQRKLRAKLLTKAYEDELRAYEARERFELAELKAKAKEIEQKYKEKLFKEPPRASQAAKIYSRKNGPRNPKLSQWISRGGFAKPKKAAPMKVKENDLLPLLLEDFPHLHISRPVMNKMWHQQLAQIDHLKSTGSKNKFKLQSEALETLKRHELLVDLIKKEQAHNRRLQELKQHINRQKCAQNKMKERRQQIVRAKKYYQDYRVQLRAKMMRARTREERIFKNLFEEGLEIQKQRLHELRSYAKDKRAEQKREHQAELEAMECYYKDQFSMLAEAVSEERREIQTREKAQATTLNKVKRELRSKMEKEIKELQDMITRDDDDSFFRELEADRLKTRLLVASFQYSKNYQFL